MFTRALNYTVLLLVVVLVAAACGNSDPESHTFALEIRDRAIVGESTFTIAQNDAVTFEVTSAEGGDFHIHGYDYEVPLEPGETAVFAFEATATGQFTLSLHPGHHGGIDHAHEDIPLGTLVVMPR